jgi:hypothetical protein
LVAGRAGEREGMAAKGRLFLLLVLCLFAGSRIAAAATNPQDGM